MHAVSPEYEAPGPTPLGPQPSLPWPGGGFPPL
jgi:hypothetical protein